MKRRSFPQPVFIDGWSVHHCGHPTALYPYYLQTPEGELVTAPNGFAFRLKAEAVAACRLLAAGSYVPVLQFGYLRFYVGSVERSWKIIRGAACKH